MCEKKEGGSVCKLEWREHTVALPLAGICCMLEDGWQEQAIRARNLGESEEGLGTLLPYNTRNSSGEGDVNVKTCGASMSVTERSRVDSVTVGMALGGHKCGLRGSGEPAFLGSATMACFPFHKLDNKAQTLKLFFTFYCC